tara:strand:- start:596 stop:1180 length:585 start_codon:yes stop_codon:yes gene_type:complete
MARKSKNLSDNLRSSIKRAALQDAPATKEREKAGRDVNKAVIALRDILLDDRLDAFRSVPEDFFVSHDGFRVFLTSSDREGTYVRMDGKRLRLPAAWLRSEGGDGETLKTAKQQRAFEAYSKAVGRLVECKKQIEQIDRGLYDLLHAVKTTSQLLALWPEAERFMPPEDAPPTVNLPMKVIDINAMLGITNKAA